MIPINAQNAPQEQSVPAVGVKFRKHGKVYYFSSQSLQPAINEMVVVETKYGLELGTVVHSKNILRSKIEEELHPIIRQATEKDIEQMEHFAAKEAEIEELCKERIHQQGLEMKLVSALYSFNGSRIIFYFTAEGRVDFRELVKVLTNELRTKIELRQIGPREETKLLGGIGKCGRILCCHAWMNKISSVTLQMAADQFLSTKNIDKLSGLCGRLLCCLEHEVDFYQEQVKKFPALQAEIMTDKGKGRVIDVNVLKSKIKVALEDKTIIEVDHRVS